MRCSIHVMLNDGRYFIANAKRTVTSYHIFNYVFTDIFNRDQVFEELTVKTHKQIYKILRDTKYGNEWPQSIKFDGGILGLGYEEDEPSPRIRYGQ